MAQGRKKHSHAVISPATDHILTGTYVLLVLYSLYTFWYSQPDHSDLFWFLLFCAVVVVAIKLTEAFAYGVCRDIISKKLLNSGPYPDPLAKNKGFSKFVGTLWQLVIHVSMTIFELYILWDESWLSHPYTTLVPFEYTPKQSLRLFYIFQIAIWIITCFSHRFNSDAHAHKDYIIMYVHHLATIALVSISYAAGQTKIGLIVLFVHDISDIGIDFLKLSNYLTLEGPRHFFGVELAYFTTMVMWFYYRLWYYPFYIIYYGPIFGLGYIGNSIHGDLPTIFILTQEQLAYYWWVGYISLFLLVLLFLMHIWWFLLLARIFVRILQTPDLHTTGAQEYEGESDDEEESSPAVPQNAANTPAVKQKAAVEEQTTEAQALKTVQRKSRKE